MAKLRIENLEVTSFTTEPGEANFAQNVARAGIGDPFCCSGCVSGCGINPTAGGCASGGGSIGQMEPQFM